MDDRCNEPGAPREGTRRDRGQALGLVLMAVALIASIGVGIARVSTRLAERGRAQNAADAAALAGVTGGAAAAASLAAHNGGVLVSFTMLDGAQGTTVTVEVVVGEERATARASNAP